MNTWHDHADSEVCAGVDIGGTKTAVVLSRSIPQILSRIEFATEPDRGPERTLILIKDAIRKLLHQQSLTTHHLKSVGITCGSPLDISAGLIQSPPNLPTWVNVPVVETLSRDLGAVCRLENDANAGAIAEHRFGAGLGSENMVFLTMGTGLGAGIIVNNRLYRGSSGFAGEIGHIRLTEYGPIGYNKPGSAEGWASGHGIAQVAHMELAVAERSGETSRLSSLNGCLSAKDVAEAAKESDGLALRVLEESGRKLGSALAILIDILNPSKIVIGGMAVRLGDALLNPARKVVEREALRETAGHCELVPAKLGEQIGDVAALCVAGGDL